MKRQLLTILLAGTASASIGQVTAETVSIGSGYINQGFYSLENGDVGQIPKNSWDISFETSGFGAGIRVNGANQIKLWRYPYANNSNFGSALDTTGITSWSQLINSDTSWARGAFNQNNNPANPFDLGWGTYNTVTHKVAGDSLYIIALANGEHKQLDIIELMSGEFRFQYANLDGSQVIVDTVRKSDYPNKNFGYYHFNSQTAPDLEPVTNTEWDFKFTQYVTYVAPNVPMGVSGVLSNNGVEIAKIAEHPDAENYQNWFGKSYSNYINSIGYDWKQLNYTTFQFEIEDSLLFFVKATTGDVWKVIFTGFGGSATGNYEFTKERLSTASLETLNNESATLTVYPNPNSGNLINIVLDIPETHEEALVKIIDLSGRIAYSEVHTNTGSLTQHPIANANLKAGVYLVHVEFNGNQLTQKLIIQ